MSFAAWYSYSCIHKLIRSSSSSSQILFYIDFFVCIFLCIIEMMRRWCLYHNVFFYLSIYSSYWVMFVIRVRWINTFALVVLYVCASTYSVLRCCAACLLLCCVPSNRIIYLRERVKMIVMGRRRKRIEWQVALIDWMEGCRVSGRSDATKWEWTSDSLNCLRLNEWLLDRRQEIWSQTSFSLFMILDGTGCGGWMEWCYVMRCDVNQSVSMNMK